MLLCCFELSFADVVITWDHNGQIGQKPSSLGLNVANWGQALLHLPFQPTNQPTNQIWSRLSFMNFLIIKIVFLNILLFSNENLIVKFDEISCHIFANNFLINRTNVKIKVFKRGDISKWRLCKFEVGIVKVYVFWKHDGNFM